MLAIGFWAACANAAVSSARASQCHAVRLRTTIAAISRVVDLIVFISFAAFYLQFGLTCCQ
jgi:hypothetical protein